MMVQSQSLLPMATDHYIISFNILFKKLSSNSSNVEFCNAFKFFRADTDGIFYHLLKSDLSSCFSYTDVDQSKLYQYINDINYLL